MRALVVAAVMTMSAAPALAKPGAVFIPPMSLELGAGTPIDDAVIGNSTELRIGASWASLYWKPTPIDISIGYVGSYKALGDEMSALDDLHMHGLYFELAYALENHRHWRTWFGLRVETMSGEYQERSLSVLGAALRLGAEVYSAGVGGVGDNRAAGMFAGAFAVGVYVEGTRRTVPDELGPIGVGAGLSVRIPFIAAVGN